MTWQELRDLPESIPFRSISRPFESCFPSIFEAASSRGAQINIERKAGTSASSRVPERSSLMARNTSKSIKNQWETIKIPQKYREIDGFQAFHIHLKPMSTPSRDQNGRCRGDAIHHHLHLIPPLVPEEHADHSNHLEGLRQDFQVLQGSKSFI